MRKSRKAAGAAAAVTAAIGSVVTATPAAAVTGPSNYTHNICGALGCNGLNQGSVVATGAMKFTINSYTNIPVAVHLQEICAGQFDDFKNFLRTRSANYWGVRHTQLVIPPGGGCGPTAQDYGNVTYGLSDVDPHTSGRTQTGAFSAQWTNPDWDPGEPTVDEPRGFACIRGRNLGSDYWTCGAHLTFRSDTVATSQFNEYRSNIQAKGLRRFWGGDFYLNDTQLSALPGWSWTTHREADFCNSNFYEFRWTARSTSEKLDYAFRTNTNVTCSADALVLPSTAADMWSPSNPNPSFRSDHRIVGGYHPW